MVAVQSVIVKGYAPDLNAVDLMSLTRDPFLVPAVLGGPESLAVSGLPGLYEVI